MTTGNARPAATGEVARYLEVHRGAAFARLRSRSRRYLAWLTASSAGLFAATVGLAVWAPGLLAVAVVGHVSLGVLLAGGLLLLPGLVAAFHRRYANRRLDPAAAQVRAELEQTS